jgi:hypothetical protein
MAEAVFRPCGGKNMEEKTFCCACRKEVAFTVEERDSVSSFRGGSTVFREKIGICSECGGLCHFMQLRDFNLKSLYDAYRAASGFISLEQTQAIAKMYSIGKRPLSLLLGWGDVTYTRFCEGHMPSNQYADILRRLYEDPVFYWEILEKNKALVSPSAYKKSRAAVEKLLKNESGTREQGGTVNKTVSLPVWLCERADQAGINISVILCDALKTHLQAAK